MVVNKRDGRQQEFDQKKIVDAMVKAYEAERGEADEEFKQFAGQVAESIEKLVKASWEVKDHKVLSVEDIQDVIENKLMASRYKDVAKQYILYRDKRTMLRKNTTDQTVMEMLGGTNEYWATENSNKNPKEATVQRDYLAGILSTDLTRRYLLDEELRDAHDQGIIHFHDADYAIESINNCSLINLDDMLQNGTIVNKVAIDPPHKFITACTIATQIITAVTSSQYGGTTISLTHLAPFVRKSYDKYVQKYKEWGFNDSDAEQFAELDTRKEITDGVQTFNYQVNSMSTTNGQAPFLSVMMYLNEDPEYTKEIAMLIEEFLNQRIIGMKNEKGVYVTQAFPKLLYVLDENNITEDSEYYYLTELAAKCTAKRMVPDYISAKVMKELKGDVYPCMGCRSFLTPDTKEVENIAKAKNYDPNKGKYYGRFNTGVVTVNLPDIAFSSEGDMDKFWELFEYRTELAHKALKMRHDRLIGVTSDIAPILWRGGAFARLEKGEKIDELLFNNYSTLSLGYAGLYECVKYMTGHSHADGGIGEEFGLKIMQALTDKCAKWREAENIAYSPYGSPIESTTDKFARCLKKRFGNDIFIKLDGKDRNFITNSYHVFVEEEINPYDKLTIESKFQKLSAGGAISYIECADMTHNIPAVLDVLKFIYNNIMYAELNTKSDYCQVCGYDGEIKIIDNNGKLDWKCPNCGNMDHDKMNVARRTCGYIGTNFWNRGRTDEINNRVVHLDNHEVKL